VRVDPDRRSPRVTYDATSKKLVLAGGDPILRALAPAFDHRGDVAEEALVALAAHCAGVLNRALVPVTDATESAALVALLDRLADYEPERPEPQGAP
jgi:hypothetical protein